MQDHVANLSNGVAAAVSQELITETLKTPQCHQAIRVNADTIVKCGAGAIGLAVAAVPAVLPVFLAIGVVAGVDALLDWLTKPATPAAPAPAPKP